MMRKNVENAHNTREYAKFTEDDIYHNAVILLYHKLECGLYELIFMNITRQIELVLSTMCHII